MIRLIYVSRARPGVDDATAEMILARSRPSNQAAGLTGLLVFDGVRFMQALEGEGDAVGSTYGRIRQDTRHEGCMVLDQGPVSTRVFPCWDMAWRRVSRYEDPEALGRAVGMLTNGIADPAVARAFERFARAGSNG